MFYKNFHVYWKVLIFYKMWIKGGGEIKMDEEAVMVEQKINRRKDSSGQKLLEQENILCY